MLPRNVSQFEVLQTEDLKGRCGRGIKDQFLLKTQYECWWRWKMWKSHWKTNYRNASSIFAEKNEAVTSSSKEPMQASASRTFLLQHIQRKEEDTKISCSDTVALQSFDHRKFSAQKYESPRQAFQRWIKVALQRWIDVENWLIFGWRNGDNWLKHDWYFSLKDVEHWLNFCWNNADIWLKHGWVLVEHTLKFGWSNVDTRLKLGWAITFWH